MTNASQPFVQVTTPANARYAPKPVAIAGLATLAAPTFTGVPTAPTAAVATNTTQLATTAFVQAATKLKTATVALTTVTHADATDLPTVIELANLNKAAINAIIAALKA
jgi:hypothetical protein